MVQSCAAYNCRNRFSKNSDVSFHRFPVDVTLRKAWTLAIGRDKFIPSNFSTLCSVHFKKSDFLYKIKANSRLKNDAVPTIFNFFPERESGDVDKDVISKSTIRRRRTCLHLKYFGTEAVKIKNKRLGKQIKLLKDVSTEAKKVSDECRRNIVVSPKVSTKKLTGTLLTPEKLQTLCRLCLEDGVFYSITTTTIDNLKVSFLLEYCLSLSISAEKSNDLPQNICKSCLDSLCQAYQFKKRCCDNDVILKFISESSRLQNEKLISESEVNEYETLLEVKMETDNEDDEITENQFKEGIVTNDEELLDEDENENKVEMQEDKLKAQEEEKNNVNDRLEEISNIENFSDPQTANDAESRNKTHPYKCSTCGATFKNLLDCRSHKKRLKHAEFRLVACEICGKLMSRRSFAKHLRLHNGTKTDYQCDICHRKFNAMNNLKRHIMIHTGETPFSCEKCGKGFIQKALLIAHRKSHSSIYTEEKRCEYCDKRFERLNSLAIHLRKHSAGQKNVTYVCKKCPLTFVNRLDYKKHLLTHLEKEFLCSHCGKVFKRKALFDMHFRTHTGEKPYVCSVCDKKFGQAQRLKRHLLVHTGERPYKCKFCTWAFKQHPHLLTHLKTHTGEKPYSCSICLKAFASKHNLSTHLRVHTQEKPFSCVICGCGFNTLNGLKKHQLYCK